MLFVVGLGNPGPKYERTRHNVGYEVVDELARRHRFPALKEKAKALRARGSIGGRDVMLIEPTTYMNLSGEAVGPLLHYFRQDASDLVVVHDELDFEPGMVRIKKGGGHGGHNGLRSLISHLGPDFVRVRVGIGKPPPRIDGAAWVLTSFDAESRQLVDDAVGVAADAVEALVQHGLQRAMGRFNRRPKPPTEEDEGRAEGLDETRKDV